MQVNNNDNNKAEQLLQIQLMSQIFKQTLGDSPTFQLVMESITKAMEDNNSTLGGLFTDASNSTNSDKSNTKELQGLANTIESKSTASDSFVSSSSIESAIDEASEKYGIDKNLIRAVIKQESSFNANSISTAGAMGLMQLMPGTAEDMGVSNPYDIEENVDGGTKYLRNMLQMYNDSKEMALAAYNAGPGTVQNRGVKGAKDIYKMPEETINYVKKVMQYYGK